jgi:hypothetical protein
LIPDHPRQVSPARTVPSSPFVRTDQADHPDHDFGQVGRPRNEPKEDDGDGEPLTSQTGLTTLT